ncbi:MAG: GH25 family lysozyme [Huintestinicola sp.]
MKYINKKAAALVIAAVMCCCVSTPVFAEFVDPAVVYEQYKKDKQNKNNQQQEETAVTEVSEDSLVVGELPEDDEVKVEDAESPAQTEETVAEEPPAKKVTKPASEVVITSYKSTVYVGDTFKIGYRLKPKSSDDTVTYSVSSKSKASVDTDGNVTALAKGTVIVTVTASSGVKDRFSVNIKENPNSSASDTSDITETGTSSDTATSSDTSDLKQTIELNYSTVTLYVGERSRIRYELTPASPSDKVTFTSGNRAIVKVDSNGNLTAKGSGTTTVTCKASSGAAAKVTVHVLDVVTEEKRDQMIEEDITYEYNSKGELIPSAVRFSDESVGVQIGKTVSLDARVYPAGCKYTYTIKSDNSSVAKVDSFGNVTGIKAGNATITIETDNGKTDSVSVTVYGDVIPGIDVSKWNGDVDWKKVKNSGMAEFAMIRASYGYEDTDPKLAENVAGCEQNGIPYGFYHYMYARNVSEAKKEAAYFLNAISKYSPEYPVVLDIEEDFYNRMSRKEVTAIVTTFMDAVEGAGYYTMIYSYAKFFSDNLYMDQIDRYDIWVACWGDEDKLNENYGYHYGMWQYSETGKVPGITEYTDLNYCYKDYRSIIKKYGLNRPKR